MATVIAHDTVHIVDGDYNNSQEKALFGTPGTNDLRGYYACDLYLRIALLDDMSIWLAPAGGRISAHNKNGSNRDEWTPKLYANKSTFSVNCPVGGDIEVPSTAVLVFSGKVDSGKSGDVGAGPVWYEIPTVADAVTGSSIPSGYVKVNGNITLEGSDPIKRTAKVYCSGVVWYGSPSTQGATMDDTIVPLTDIIINQIFDYYPWARKVSGEWRSLNRSGGSLKRKSGGVWQDMKNSTGNGTSKAFRKSGGSWIKSPKTGRE